MDLTGAAYAGEIWKSGALSAALTVIEQRLKREDANFVAGIEQRYIVSNACIVVELMFLHAPQPHEEANLGVLVRAMHRFSKLEQQVAAGLQQHAINGLAYAVLNCTNNCKHTGHAGARAVLDAMTRHLQHTEVRTNSFRALHAFAKTHAAWFLDESWLRDFFELMDAHMQDAAWQLHACGLLQYIVRADTSSERARADAAKLVITAGCVPVLVKSMQTYKETADKINNIQSLGSCALGELALALGDDEIPWRGRIVNEGRAEVLVRALLQCSDLHPESVMAGVNGLYSLLTDHVDNIRAVGRYCIPAFVRAMMQTCDADIHRMGTHMLKKILSRFVILAQEECNSENKGALARHLYTMKDCQEILAECGGIAVLTNILKKCHLSKNSIGNESWEAVIESACLVLHLACLCNTRNQDLCAQAPDSAALHRAQG